MIILILSAREILKKKRVLECKKLLVDIDFFEDNLEGFNLKDFELNTTELIFVLSDKYGHCSGRYGNLIVAKEDNWLRDIEELLTIKKGSGPFTFPENTVYFIGSKGGVGVSTIISAVEKIVSSNGRTVRVVRDKYKFIDNILNNKLYLDKERRDQILGLKIDTNKFFQPFKNNNSIYSTEVRNGEQYCTLVEGEISKIIANKSHVDKLVFVSDKTLSSFLYLSMKLKVALQSDITFSDIIVLVNDTGRKENMLSKEIFDSGLDNDVFYCSYDKSFVDANKKEGDVLNTRFVKDMKTFVKEYLKL